MAGSRWLRSVVRSTKAVSFFAWYGLELIVRRPKTRRAGAEWLHRFCAAMLRGFDITISVDGDFPRSGVLISDHLSYLDIIVYAAIGPVVYCSKAEVEKMPVLGFMALSAGTVMVERGAGGSAERARLGMQAAETEGVPVVFFPEGTTTLGDSMLPFRSGLLAVSLEAEQPIRPAYIHYTLDKDNGPEVSVHGDITWGDTPMLKHIFTFLGLEGVHAWVRIAPEPIRFSNVDDRKQSAVEARAAVMTLAGMEPDGSAEEVEEELAR